MTIPGTQPRRTADIVSNTIVAVVITVASTVLGYKGQLAPEGILAAYGIAAATSGLPIVVRRTEGGHG